MKKYERINQYLEKILAKNEDLLKKMTWYNLRELQDFFDIGERTLRNILKEFKLKNGMFSENQPNTPKRENVWNYLEKQYKKLPEQTFQNIVAVRLMDVSELSGICKTTISITFTKFKQEHFPKKDFQIADRIDPKTSQVICSNIQTNFKKIRKVLSLNQIEIADQMT